MSKTKDLPERLKPFSFHGLDLQINGKEAVCTCPFCGKESKFSINVENSKYRCFVCGEEGNASKFVRRVWEESAEQSVDLRPLAKERGLKPETLDQWGVTKSFITGEWILPGCNSKGEVTNVYRYIKLKGHHKLLATSTLNHGIFGTNLYDPKKPVVYLCEGPWDAMKLWETLGSHRESNDGTTLTYPAPVPTKDKKKSLLQGANVLGVPGCSTFLDSWKDVFVKKKVYIVYDNDHPKKQPRTGKLLEPAGYAGVRRVSGKLANLPTDIKYLRWGDKGYDKSLPDGTDVRDFLAGKGSIGDLFAKLTPVPKEWLENGKVEQQDKGVEPEACNRWLKVSNSWRKALKWSDGLEVSLSVMMASAVSTDLVGDQLWVRILGPASCGKSTLCEALSVDREHVLAKSTIRGFQSGYKTDQEGEEDHSLLAKVRNKTLIIKDGDTLLSSPNLQQILSEARDIYDKVSRTHYRNKVSREYTGVNMTFILCGTGSLHSMDSSELGERFLTCVIMEGIDDDAEDEVLIRVAQREDKNLSSEESGGGAGQDPMLEKAMALTGGYLSYLRKNDKHLMQEVTCSKEHLRLITRVGKFVALMRARPSDKQQENAEREFAARLVSQLLRLAKCLAVVLNRKTVDDEVLRRVIKVAKDSSRGITLKMCIVMREEEETTPDFLALETNQEKYKVVELLRFLRNIGVTEQVVGKTRTVKRKAMWRVSERTETLFQQVLDWEPEG